MYGRLSDEACHPPRGPSATGSRALRLLALAPHPPPLPLPPLSAPFLSSPLSPSPPSPTADLKKRLIDGRTRHTSHRMDHQQPAAVRRRDKRAGLVAPGRTSAARTVRDNTNQGQGVRDNQIGTGCLRGDGRRRGKGNAPPGDCSRPEAGGSRGGFYQGRPRSSLVFTGGRERREGGRGHQVSKRATIDSRGRFFFLEGS